MKVKFIPELELICHLCSHQMLYDRSAIPALTSIQATQKKRGRLRNADTSTLRPMQGRTVMPNMLLAIVGLVSWQQQAPLRLAGIEEVLLEYVNNVPTPMARKYFPAK